MDLRDTELRIAQDDLSNAKTLASASERARKDQTEQADLQARASRQELEEQLQELELRYEDAKQRVDAAEVRATETGVVAEVPVRLGDRVPEGTVLARLAQLNQMVAEVPVAANMISQLQVGQLATIELPSSPPQQVDGAIRMISPLPSANMTHLIEVEFKNPTRLLLAGQPTEVRFETLSRNRLFPCSWPRKAPTRSRGAVSAPGVIGSLVVCQKSISICLRL